MITQVEVENFRGALSGGVEGLSALSILVGPNNSGKSTVLEAIAAARLVNPRLVVQVLLRRGGPAVHAVRSALGSAGSRVLLHEGGEVSPKTTVLKLYLANQMNLKVVHEARAEGLKEPIYQVHGVWSQQALPGPDGSQGGSSLSGEMVCCLDDEGRLSLSHHHGPAWGGAVSLVDVMAVGRSGELEDAYTVIEGAGKTAAIVRALQRSMPKLTDLKILKVEGSFVLHAICNGAPPVPAYVGGDGFKRFLAIAASVLRAPDTVTLLEEPESFQHPRYLQELAALLRDAAASGTQVILSTHCIELIDLLLGEPSQTMEGAAFPTVHRLRLVHGRLAATTLDAGTARAARQELLEDLRG